ncbi:MAG TPA: thiosulfate oxidation carrier complex protein SoxZ [Alphaproteobacteria bacterium]|nr:thiosulfate oxidation carrier complex protein SoxZ [Alphaproteobacteria bacterium]
MSEVRLRVPPNARRGEIVEIKTLVSHDMESGQRRDDAGKLIARKIINKFVCTFEGEEVLSADWAAAIAANPYFAFHVRASRSGTFEFAWTDDDGTVTRQRASIMVS